MVCRSVPPNFPYTPAISPPACEAGTVSIQAQTATIHHKAIETLKFSVKQMPSERFRRHILKQF